MAHVREAAMRFDVERDAFARAVSLVAAATGRHAALAHLGGIRLVVEGDKLHLAATDLDVAMEVTIAVSSASGEPVVLPASRLDEAVSGFPAGAVHAERSEVHPNTFELRCGRARVSMPTLPLGEFPRIVDATEAPARLPGADFLQLVARTLPAVSRDENRPILGGIVVEAVDGRLQLTASDGYRLHRATAEVPGFPDSDLVIVPRLAATLLLRTFPKDAETIGVAWSGDSHHVAFVADDARLTTRLIEGEPPRYEQLIDGFAPQYTMEADTAELLEAVERVGRMAAQYSPVRLDFAAGEDSVGLRARGADQTVATDVVTVAWDGPDLATGYNPRFFADAIKMCGTERVRVRLQSSDKFGRLEPVGEDDRFALTMPVSTYKGV